MPDNLAGFPKKKEEKEYDTQDLSDNRDDNYSEGYDVGYNTGYNQAIDACAEWVEKRDNLLLKALKKIESVKIVESGKITIGDLSTLIQVMKSTARIAIIKGIKEN